MELFDAKTGELLAGIASGTIRRGEYVETMRRFRAPTSSTKGPPYPVRYLIGSGDAPGRYDVDVVVPGYGTWQRGDVLVEAKECGGLIWLQTRHFDIYLEQTES